MLVFVLHHLGDLLEVEFAKLASYANSFYPMFLGSPNGSFELQPYRPSPLCIIQVTEIDLPDWNATTNPNSKYTFTYENTPAHSGYKTGRLASVTLPTGGTITYAYTGGNNGIDCTDGSTAGLQRYTPDSGSNYWNYVRSGTNPATTTLTDPQGNQTVFQFQGIYETQRQLYQGPSSGGTLLQTLNTYYNCTNANTQFCSNTAALPFTQRTVINTMPTTTPTSFQPERIETFNAQTGVPTEVDDYAFQSGNWTPLKKTLIAYAALTGNNLTGFPSQVQVQNGSGTILAQTNFNYDQSTLALAPANTPHLLSISGSRGNLTSVQRCTNLSSCSTSYLQTTMTYDTAGQLQSIQDPKGNTTSFSYSDVFYTDNGSNPPAVYSSSVPTDAYVTQVTLPVSGTGTLNFGYYYYSGQRAVAKDQNGNSTYAHFDSFGRPSSSYGPSLPIAGTSNMANPWTLINYTSPTQLDTYTDINDGSTTASSSCTVCRHDEAVLDGLGRTVYSYLKSDPEGQAQVDTVYDSIGRVKTVSHPHRAAASTTDGIETPTYDALGRVAKVTHPDGTYSQTFYGAAVGGTGLGGVTTSNCTATPVPYPTVFIDESGRKRQTWIDTFGRTIEGDEPDSSGNLTSYTCYSYDPLGNLLQVSHGTQTRTYGYDALSRVISVSIPERVNCAVTFAYDNNSNVQTRTAPAPNQTSCSTKVTTTYSYDGLNRLTQTSYGSTAPVATPTVQYGYDNVAPAGCTPPALTDSNGKGRRTSMCDGSGATSWAHDAAGRIITEKRTILGITQALSYAYNLDSSIYSVTYPSGKTVNYTVSNAQRLTATKDVANNIQFATAASYAPPGGLWGMVTGQISGGFTGISESHTYNSSLEYTSTQATSTAGTALNLSLCYNQFSFANGCSASATNDNGSVTGVVNNVDSGRNQSLAYDSLNRISSATTQATSGVDCWGEGFAPDALANLNTINATQCSPPGTLSVSVDGNNHINTTGFGYDGAGNMTADGQPGVSYSFDAENRLVEAAVTGGPYCYVYDGLGLRVAKKSGANSDCSGGTATKLYWRSLSGDAFAETDGSGNTGNSAYNEYVLFAGRRISSRNGTGTIFYYFADQVGSTRTITTGSGTGQTPGQLCYDADFTPYGQEMQHTEHLQATPCPPNYRFTGYEFDSETGLSYAFARYYSPRLGRFLSTDPLGGSIGSLQSHNAYAYVVNNPMNLTDARGLREDIRGQCPQVTIDGVSANNLWDGCGAAGWLVRALIGDEFDILEAAFTPTDIARNPEFWNKVGCDFWDCPNIQAFLPVYGNWGLLSLLGGSWAKMDSRLHFGITLAFMALQNPGCRDLFASDVDPGALLMSLEFKGNVQMGDLGNAGEAAITQPVLTSIPMVDEQGNAFRQSSFSHDATITVNSGASAPFNVGFNTSPFGGYDYLTNVAAMFVHETGHGANYVYGTGSSAIVTDSGGDPLTDFALSLGNSNRVFNACFVPRQ